MNGPFVADTFGALGTTAVVCVVDADRADQAVTIVRAGIARLDKAASRFRDDSELHRLHSFAGRPVPVSAELYRAIEDSLSAARFSGGVVDPTIGQALEILGYDRDFSQVAADGPGIQARVRQSPGWQGIKLDPVNRTVTLPKGVRLDLGATAKAGCADLTAEQAALATGTGVLVSLGGDVAVSGAPPEGGWAIRIADRHDAPDDAPSVTVAIQHGGLATSGTTARRWSRGGREFHHLLDPSTGQPADTCWRTVTVTAHTCVRANTASTAAIVLGSEAPAWLHRHGFCARLVANDGTVLGVGGWPDDALAARGEHAEVWSS